MTFTDINKIASIDDADVNMVSIVELHNQDDRDVEKFAMTKMAVMNVTESVIGALGGGVLGTALMHHLSKRREDEDEEAFNKRRKWNLISGGLSGATVGAGAPIIYKHLTGSSLFGDPVLSPEEVARQKAENERAKMIQDGTRMGVIGAPVAAVTAMRDKARHMERLKNVSSLDPTTKASLEGRSKSVVTPFSETGAHNASVVATQNQIQSDLAKVQTNIKGVTTVDPTTGAVTPNKGQGNYFKTLQSQEAQLLTKQLEAKSLIRLSRPMQAYHKIRNPALAFLATLFVPQVAGAVADTVTGLNNRVE